MSTLNANRHIRRFAGRQTGLAALSTVAAAVASLVSSSAFAAPPTAGAYAADITQSHVEDATSEGLKLPNTVLCYLKGSGANQAEVLNQGDFSALVDRNKCENSGSAGTATTSAPSYMRALVNSTRADNASPLLGKIWFIEDELNTGPGASTSGIIYARLSATQPASDSSPYGVFHADFCALPNGASLCSDAFYGYADGNGASVSAFQTGDRNISMVLSGTTAAGSGRIKVSEASGAAAADWVFAYDSAYFHRRASNASSDQCFDRSFANADKTAWRYGVYQADGSRLERNSGFPIKSGNAYGYVGYWGLQMQNGATLADGATVTRYAYGGGGQQPSAGDFTLVRKDGRLKKQVKHATTLSGIQNLPIMFWVNQTFVDSGGVNREAGTNLEIRWNGSQFVITGISAQGGSFSADVAGNRVPEAVLQASWNINSWSQSLGGPVNIVTRDGSGAYLAPGANSVVSYRAESVVAPGDAAWPTNLHCVSDCPVGGSAFSAALDNPVDGNAAYAPLATSNWQGGTQTQSSRFNWSPVAQASVIHYSADAASGLLTTAGGAPVAWSAVNAPANSQFQNGFQSGRLVDDAGLAALQCAGNGSAGSGFYCPNKVDEVATIYTWETGANPWNKFSGLRSGGSYVAFDAPLQLSYAVPASVSSSYANASLVLQYNGFGELNGVPGKCVDPLTNADAPCNNNGNNRWVAAFVIPEGSTLSDGTTTYYVKPLEQELRLKRVALSNCSALTPPTIADSALPGVAAWADPHLSNGAAPTVNGAPRVIDGVVQF